MRRTRLRFLLGLIFMSIGGALGLFYMPTVRKFTSMDIVLFFGLSSLFLGVYLLSGVIKLDKLFSIKGSRLIRRRLKEPRGSKKHIAEERHAPAAKQDIYHTMLQKMLAGLDPSMDVSQTAEVRQAIEELFVSILSEEKIVLPRPERRKLFEQVVAEIFGLGLLEPLLADKSITEIMVNGAKQIYIRRRGRIYREAASFESDDHLMRIIDRIVTPLGRRLDESSPCVDARLPDGSRVHAVIPPISLIGPVLTIRKFAHKPITAQPLIEFGTVTSEAMIFLKACVLSKMNVIISGAKETGKTTLLNVLSQYIPGDERIITIENVAELMLRQEHVITLETRPPNIQGRGEVTIQDLVGNALLMQSERIIVGELYGDEALPVIQAMNAGYDGMMSTINSKYPREALRKLVILSNLEDVHLQPPSIRRQIADSLDLLIHMERLRDGSRRITLITEIHGMSGDDIAMRDIFFFEETGVSKGKIIGQLWPTGLIPSFMDKIERCGFHLPSTLFGQPAST